MYRQSESLQVHYYLQINMGSRRPISNKRAFSLFKKGEKQVFTERKSALISPKKLIGYNVQV